MTRAELLFLDTSIHIARLLHGPAQKGRVEARGGNYLRASGLVCRQEFRRRVLKTAEQLLRMLTEQKGYGNVHANMTRLVQSKYHKRRATICLGLLAQATGNTDEEKTDRLKVRLRTLILTGLSMFDGWLDGPAHESSECGCGRSEVRERGMSSKSVEMSVASWSKVGVGLLNSYGGESPNEPLSENTWESYRKTRKRMS
jgi:hypothetical protein